MQIALDPFKDMPPEPVAPLQELIEREPAVNYRKPILIVAAAVILGVQFGVVASVVKPWQGEAPALITEELPTVPEDLRRSPVIPPYKRLLAGNTVAVTTGSETSSSEPPALSAAPTERADSSIAAESAAEVIAPVQVAETTRPAKDSVNPQPRPRARPTRLRQVPPASAGKTERGLWLDTQPASNFTLQLIAVVDSARFNAFVRRLPESSHVARIRVKKAGQVRNVLLQGIYPDKAAAQRAARSVGLISGVKPWVRRIGDVRRELQANGDPHVLSRLGA